MVSVNASSREFLQSGSTESRELQDRLGQLRLHWDTAQAAVDSWREGLRRSLMQCQVRRPQSAPQAHVGGSGRYFYHRWAASVQPNVARVRKHVCFIICLQRGPPAHSEADAFPRSPGLLPRPTPSIRVPASIPRGQKCHPNTPPSLSFCQEGHIAE